MFWCFKIDFEQLNTNYLSAEYKWLLHLGQNIQEWTQ